MKALVLSWNYMCLSVGKTCPEFNWVIRWVVFFECTLISRTDKVQSSFSLSTGFTPRLILSVKSYLPHKAARGWSRCVGFHIRQTSEESESSFLLPLLISSSCSVRVSGGNKPVQPSLHTTETACHKYTFAHHSVTDRGSARLPVHLFTHEWGGVACVCVCVLPR